MLSKRLAILLNTIGLTVALSAQDLVSLNNTLELFTIGQNNQFFSAANLNAAAEFVSAVGQVHMQSGSGTRTISSAGGIIYWNNGSSITFANAGTTVRIGIQDVDATTGIGDGTFDVFQELVGVTDPAPATSTTIAATMESGSKTLTQGQIVAVQMTMTARAGADSWNLPRIISIAPQTYGLPYGVFNGAKSSSLFGTILKFDDGTYGWISTAPLLFSAAAAGTATYGNGSTPDEYAALLSIPFDCTVVGFGMRLDNVIAGDDLEFILYSDPLGTPAVIEAITVDPDFFTTTDGVHRARFTTARDLEANTVYGFAVRPTTANTITISWQQFTTGMDAPLKAGQPFGTITMATRTNQSGAFSATASSIPSMSLAISRVVQ